MAVEAGYQGLVVPELVYPGSALRGHNADRSQQVFVLLSMMEMALAQAALALWLFERSPDRPTRPSPDQWASDDERRRQIEQDLAERLGIDGSSHDGQDELRNTAEVELRREKWTAGAMPASYELQLATLHARSFLFTMDRLRRIVNALACEPSAPSGVLAAKESLGALLPHVKDVRDTSAHIDERSAGHRRNGKPLDLQPSDDDFVSGEGVALCLEVLSGPRGNRFGSTTSDGLYRTVEVSAEVLLGARDVVQQVLDAFEWTGPARHAPH